MNDDRRCAARAKGTGERCAKAAMRGQLVCRSHGGAASQNRAAGARREVEAKATAALASRGRVDPVTDPVDELAQVAGEVLALKDYLRDQMTQLNGLLTYWHSTELEGLSQAREDVRAVVAAYERALDRSVKTLAAMSRLDLDGRLLRIRQGQADIIVGCVLRGLAAVPELQPATVLSIRSAIAVELGQAGSYDDAPDS